MKLIFIFFVLPAVIIAQSVQIRGKIIDSDKQPVKNLPIRFTSFGDAVTTGSGEFVITVPQNVKFVDILVKDKNWQLLYPVDAKIPVPADPNFITTIIVSGINSGSNPSMDESISKFAELESLLKGIGTTNTELKAFLEKFIEIEARRLEISEPEFREEFERKEKRETAFTEISRLLNEYILRAQNLKTNFEMYSEIAFVSNPAVGNLNKAIGAYNPIFDSIYNNFNNWKAIISLAKDSVLAESFVSSVNYMIDEIHTPYIFQINESIKLINEIRLGIGSDGNSEEKKKEVRNKVSSIIENLEKKIPILENHFKTLLSKLQPELN
jgi:hypothetical protein